MEVSPAPANAVALLSADDAATYLGVSLTSFREHVAADLPCLRIGRRVLYDRRDLLRWIDARKVPSHGAAAPPRTIVSAPSPRAREILAGLRR